MNVIHDLIIGDRWTELSREVFLWCVCERAICIWNEFGIKDYGQRLSLSLFSHGRFSRFPSPPPPQLFYLASARLIKDIHHVMNRKNVGIQIQNIYRIMV